MQSAISQPANPLTDWKGRSGNHAHSSTKGKTDVFSSRRCAATLATSLLLGLALPGATATATAKKAAVKMAAAAAPTKASRLAAVMTAKSLNYYPSGAGWSKMWTNWDPAKIDADLAKADALGADNVRIIVFPTTFGWPTPSSTYQARLALAVSMAAARGLTVKFTLFDWWDGYEEATNSVSWATAVLKPYKDDKRVIAVELQNEFDANSAAAVAWARKMIPAMRSAFPTMPLTCSADGTTGAPGMAKIKAALTATPIDYYDYHFYGNSERALAIIKNAQATVAPTPLVIGEAGLNTLQNTEGEQAAYLARVFEGAEAAGVRSVAPWTLNDFVPGAIPTSTVSRLPGQYSYGLYRTDGTAKPAAAVVKAGWAGWAVPSAVLDPGFEAAVGQTPWRAFMPELGLAVKTQSLSRTGKWSVSMTNTGKTSAGSPSYRVAPIEPVKAAQKWHGEVWARGNAATGTTQIALSWFDTNDKWLGGASSASLPVGTTGWTKLVIDGVAPAGSASMQVHLKSGDNTGTVWFDDAVVSVS